MRPRNTSETRMRRDRGLLTGRLVLAGLGVLAVLNAGEPVSLTIWPGARATGLAGAMVALADEQDAAYWNPGGLGFQHGLSLSQSVGPWLPGLYPGMLIAHGSYGYGIARFKGAPLGINLGVNWTYFSGAEVDSINEQGEFLGRDRCRDAAFGVHGGMAFYDRFGLGVSVKYVRSHNVPRWAWPPELRYYAGTGRGVAADAGVLLRPFRSVSVGVAVVNFGPGLRYESQYWSGDPDYPLILRAGVCLTPTDEPALRRFGRFLRPRMMAQRDWPLLGFDPPARPVTAWNSAGAEITALQILTLRVGYFTDPVGARTGYCYGVGLGYKDYVRLDFGDDHLTYSFPTRNWKLALTVNNLGGLLAEIAGGSFGLDWLDSMH